MHSEASAEPRPAERVERALVWSILVVVLGLSTILGFLTTYLLLILVIAATVLLVRQREVNWALEPMALVLLGVFLAFLVLFSITADRPRDVLSAFNFSAFVAFVPLTVLLRRYQSPDNSDLVARLALAGATVGLGMCIVQVYALGIPRAGEQVAFTDAIRLANTTVILGFLAPVVGFRKNAGQRKWLYLLGPVVALLTVLLTSARIAMVALPIVAFITIVLLIRRRWLGVAVAAAVIGVLIAASLTNMFGNPRLASLVGIAMDIVSGQSVRVDRTIQIRLDLYEAGWQAFQQSPLVGHGFANIMEAAERFLPYNSRWYAQSLPHLHNEVLNFAVFGGVIGVAIYALLMAAPVVLAIRSPRDSQYMARVGGTITLIAAYLVMGLTDTMISFELHTSMYVGLLAILLAYCRDPDAQAK